MSVALGDLAKVEAGFPFRGKVDPVDGGEVVILQQRDLTGLASSPADEGAWRVPDTAVRASMQAGFKRHLLDTDAVLLQARGGQFLAAAFQGGFTAVAAHGLAVIRIRDAEALQPAYLSWWLNHPRTNRLLNSLSGGTHIPFISNRAIRELQLPLPAPVEQDRIVEADHVRRMHRALMQKLIKTNDQLVDAVTWRAANGQTRKDS